MVILSVAVDDLPQCHEAMVSTEGGTAGETR